jgi:glycosyltransferase involved in cell wall biosynthesis
LHRLKENQGLTGAKGEGYSVARNPCVIFLDSDDYFVDGVGSAVQDELNGATNYPIVFFRCQTRGGDFIGQKQGERFEIDLPTYLRFVSFGEAFVALNKRHIGGQMLYETGLRSHEGLGYSRVIAKFGPAFMSDIIARVYVTEGEDRLSTRRIKLIQMPRLAQGHMMMLREFGSKMGILRFVMTFLKAFSYAIVGNINAMIKR